MPTLEHRVRNLRRRYNLSYEEWMALRAEARGACRACGTPESELGRTLNVDHCHDTGEVRGLLCHSCNLALGHVKHDISLLQRLINYLQTTSLNTPNTDP